MKQPRWTLVTIVCLLMAGSLVFLALHHFSTGRTLSEARRGYVTHLIVNNQIHDPVPMPPPGFQLVHYAAPLGSYPAYVAFPQGQQSSAPGRHPALIWITGGFSNSIDDTSWAAATPDNDQSARAFREAGLMTMYPSLRGGNGNPGYIEGGYGEVDDVLAAADYLAHRADVDPKRIYLGGHSTGGTLALLIAESSPRFRAVFAFGPVAFAKGYGQDNLPFDVNDKQEDRLRSPAYYLAAIQTPTYLFEGEDDPSNLQSLQVMQELSHNPHLHFYSLPGVNHFSELAPTTPIVAQHIMRDNDGRPEFTW